MLSKELELNGSCKLYKNIFENDKVNVEYDKNGFKTQDKITLNL